MSPKVFITGATGYIGGDALAAIHRAHPDWQYTCLARSESKGAQVVAAYPGTRIVHGDLDSQELLSREAQAADIVLHFANADHAAGAAAIVEGLRSRASGTGYLIHTSGTGILTYEHKDAQSFGAPGGTVWDDAEPRWTQRLPDHAPHRNVDKIVLAASDGKADRVKTAIVAPPVIYDTGRGPDNTRSVQLPGLVGAFLKRGKGFYVGEGKTLWSYVNVRDLSDGYLLLAEAAAAELEGKPSKADWNEDGYYFAENGELVWGEVSREIASRLHAKGLLPSSDCDSLSAAEVLKLHAAADFLFGASSRSKASKLRALGWKPTGRSVPDSLDDLIATEAEASK